MYIIISNPPRPLGLMACRSFFRNPNPQFLGRGLPLPYPSPQPWAAQLLARRSSYPPFRRHLGTILDNLGANLGATWAVFGLSWPFLGPFCPVLGPIWTNLASSLVPRCFPSRFLMIYPVISYPANLDFCNTLQCF